MHRQVENVGWIYIQFNHSVSYSESAGWSVFVKDTSRTGTCVVG